MNGKTETVRVLQLGSPMGLYGAERWILALAKHLDRSKVKTWVGAVRDQAGLEVPLCREAEKLGLDTVVFDAPGRLNFSAVRQIRQFILANDIQILHTHFYKTDLLGLLATRGTACKIVTTPHGWSTNVDLKLRLYELMDRCIFPFMDAVAPLSEDLHNPLKGLPGLGKKLHFIRNGVDLSEIDSCSRVAKELRPWRENSEFIVGYIGQLISRKGLDLLLNALAGIKDIKWRLALVGEGPEMVFLEVLARQLGIADRVRFFGFREDRLAFLRGFDVFVLPSRLEGIPRCLMEAMAAQIPIVASDIPGCNDLIVDNQTGLLHPPEDGEALAQSLKRIAVDPNFANGLTRNARESVMEKYSAARMAREYNDLYFNLVKDSCR